MSAAYSARPRLEGKVAIVTGAAGGIGRGIALRYAEEGAAVVCTDIKDEDTAETVRLIEAAGGCAVAHHCDVSDEEHARAATALAVERFGRLDILVNNASAFIPDRNIVETAVSDWKRSIDVNINGVFLMSRYAIPVMDESGGGSIIHVASQLGQVAFAGRTWYGAAKAALIHLAKSMSIDHADQNIRVNSLSPGPVGTERILNREGGQERADALGQLTVMGRLGRVEEIANAALFLASDEASFVTGTDLLVDGGYMTR